MLWCKSDELSQGGHAFRYGSFTTFLPSTDSAPQPVGGDVQAMYGAGGGLLFGRGLLISSD